MIYLIMDSSLRGNPQPVLAATFSVAVFLFFILASPSALYVGPTILATIEAIVCTGILLSHAGVPFPEWLPSFAILVGVVGVVSTIIARRVLRIAHDYAREKDRRNRMARYFSPAVTARIESLTKKIGSAILASRATRDACGDEYQRTAAETLDVRGKSEPVETFIPH